MYKNTELCEHGSGVFDFDTGGCICVAFICYKWWAQQGCRLRPIHTVPTHTDKPQQTHMSGFVGSVCYPVCISWHWSGVIFAGWTYCIRFLQVLESLRSVVICRPSALALHLLVWCKLAFMLTRAVVKTVIWWNIIVI